MISQQFMFDYVLSIFNPYVNFFFSSRIRHTRCLSDWSSDVCSSDLELAQLKNRGVNAVVLTGTAGWAARADAVRRAGLVVVHPRAVGRSASSTCAAERRGPART